VTLGFNVAANEIFAGSSVPRTIPDGWRPDESTDQTVANKEKRQQHGSTNNYERDNQQEPPLRNRSAEQPHV